jgi:hypothetical protein
VLWVATPPNAAPRAPNICPPPKIALNSAGNALPAAPAAAPPANDAPPVIAAKIAANIAALATVATHCITNFLRLSPMASNTFSPLSIAEKTLSMAGVKKLIMMLPVSIAFCCSALNLNSVSSINKLA